MSKITKITGKAVPVEGNDIDTDRIIPARYLKEITFTNMGKYPFYDERFDAAGNPKGHPFDQPQHQGAHLLIVNQNFGCGSSREHAPQALYTVDLEKKVLLCEGKEAARFDIHESKRNALVNGTWDSTGLLLANAAKTAEVAKKLPYMAGF